MRGLVRLGLTQNWNTPPKVSLKLFFDFSTLLSSFDFSASGTVMITAKATRLATPARMDGTWTRVQDGVVTIFLCSLEGPKRKLPDRQQQHQQYIQFLTHSVTIKN